jgi:hypothetical protein
MAMLAAPVSFLAGNGSENGAPAVATMLLLLIVATIACRLKLLLGV